MIYLPMYVQKYCFKGLVYIFRDRMAPPWFLAQKLLWQPRALEHSAKGGTIAPE